MLPYRSVADLKSTWREGLSILRTEGISSFIKAALREINLNHRGFYYYLNYVYKRRIDRSYRTAEPFTVVEIDPERIDRVALGDIDRWRHIGEIRSGDWDLSDHTLEMLVKYRSVIDRFKNGTPWEETDIYREAFERIENGNTHWNGCRTVDDLDRRVVHVENLHETIKKSGFKSQSVLRGRDIKSILLSGSFDRSKTDVTVAIGRNGEFLFIDGNHRLAIAHVLGLERIPVRIVIRHTAWQDVREEILSADSPEELSERARSHLDHPDVQEILPVGF